MKKWYESLSNEQIKQLKIPKKWENMPTWERAVFVRISEQEPELIVVDADTREEMDSIMKLWFIKILELWSIKSDWRPPDEQKQKVLRNLRSFNNRGDPGQVHGRLSHNVDKNEDVPHDAPEGYGAPEGERVTKERGERKAGGGRFYGCCKVLHNNAEASESAGRKVSANYTYACACGGQFVYRGPDEDDMDVNSKDDYYHHCNRCGREAYLDHKYPYLVLPAETTEEGIKSDRND